MIGTFSDFFFSLNSSILLRYLFQSEGIIEKRGSTQVTGSRANPTGLEPHIAWTLGPWLCEPGRILRGSTTGQE